MKNKWFLILFSLSVALPQIAIAQSADEVFDQFGQEYDALKPPSEGSSVSSDYKLGQTALGSFYTTKMLSLMVKQNQQILERYEDIIQKYDLMIEQNKKIIELLTALTKDQGKASP